LRKRPTIRALEKRNDRKTTMSTTTMTPEKDLDLRVRTRNLANGKLDLKTVEAHLAGLPDLSAQAETVELEQPALLGDLGQEDD
jgi:hypothetical protein